MNVLLMCAGEQARITLAGGLPKQWLAIAFDGNELKERILERTVRMVRELVSGSIEVCYRMGKDQWQWQAALEPLDVDRGFAMPHDTNLIQNISHAAAVYAGAEVVVLLGDVVWSRAGLRHVLHDVGPTPVFYGRRGPNRHTGKIYGELFGVRCPSDWYALAAHKNEARMLWDLQKLTRSPVSGLPGDWSDDIDTDADLQEVLPKLRALAAEDP